MTANVMLGGMLTFYDYVSASVLRVQWTAKIQKLYLGYFIRI